MDEVWAVEKVKKGGHAYVVAKVHHKTGIKGAASLVFKDLDKQ